MQPEPSTPERMWEPSPELESRPRLQLRIREAWALEDPFGDDLLPLPPGGPSATPEDVIAIELDSGQERASTPVPAWLLLSLVIHALIVLGFLFGQRYFPGDDTPPTPENLEVYSVDARDLADVLAGPAERPETMLAAVPPPQRQTPLPSGQVVNLAPTPAPETPDHARYLAADNHRADRETRTLPEAPVCVDAV